MYHRINVFTAGPLNSHRSTYVGSEIPNSMAGRRQSLVCTCLSCRVEVLSHLFVLEHDDEGNMQALHIIRGSGRHGYSHPEAIAIVDTPKTDVPCSGVS